MPDVLVRDLDVEVIDRLKSLAQEENRSLQSEMKIALSKASGRLSKREMFERARQIRESIKKPQQTDSVELLREDRDR